MSGTAKVLIYFRYIKTLSPIGERRWFTDGKETGEEGGAQEEEVRSSDLHRSFTMPGPYVLASFPFAFYYQIMVLASHFTYEMALPHLHRRGHRRGAGPSAGGTQVLSGRDRGT